MKRKVLCQLLNAALISSMLLAGTSTVFAENTSSDNTTFTENFANPDRSTHAGIRLWLPGAPEDLEELKTEIRSLEEVGFKNIEIACVCDSGTSIDTVNNGWGTENWRNAVKTVLETAKEVGIKVDLTVGPHWPLALPSITPDSEASSKELQQGTLVLAPGEAFEGTAPVCDTPLDEGNSFDQLKAVTVARISGVVENEDEEDDTVTYTVDSSTIQTVDVAKDGTISFTADQADDSYNADDPNNVGKWLITSYWMRGTSQTVNGLGGVQFTEPRSYVVDHFSKEGTQAFIDFWKENILTDDVVELLKDVGGSIFEDSLEVSGDIMWSNDLLDYFQEHRGYDLTPYLPVLYGEVTDDPDLVSRVTADYNQTLNDMYIENHLDVIKEFANSYGLTFRSQTYGGSVDSSEAGAKVDIAEGELLTFSEMGISLTGDNTEGEWTVNNKFKMLRGAANLGGINILSDEIGSLLNGDYSLPINRILNFMNSDFSAGVNNMMLHGSPYRYFRGASWPTGATFSPAGSWGGFGVALNAYVPSWTILDESLEYVNRTQYILQSGKSDVDIAIYRHETSTKGTTISDGTLVDQGYTYDYISPALLTDANENAVVKDTILAPDTASYKALVVYDTLYITKEATDKIKSYAEEGLPVIIAGTMPEKAKSYGEKEYDEEIAATMKSLLDLDNVKYVEDEKEISSALEELGVVPDMSPATDQNKLSSVHRSLDNGDYYYLFNRGYEDTIETDVTLQGSGSVYKLNAYSGEVTIVNDYVQNDDGTITLSISLEPRDSILLAVSEDGSYTNGAQIEKEIQPEVETMELKNWNLSLESWSPENEDVCSEEVINDMEDLSRFNTKKTVYEETLEDIIPWSDMDAYKTVSGIGTYTTDVTLTKEQAEGKVVLDLGTLYNGYELYINDQQVKGNQVTEKADLTGYLKEGDNQIKVVVPSELMNTLKEVRSDIYGNRDSNINGLTENPVLSIQLAAE